MRGRAGGTAETKVQASLTGRGSVSRALPGVKTPGYYEASLRDATLPPALAHSREHRPLHRMTIPLILTGNWQLATGNCLSDTHPYTQDNSSHTA